MYSVSKNERREADDTTTRDTASPQCTMYQVQLYSKNEQADDTTTRDTASPQCTTHDDHDHSRARGRADPRAPPHSSSSAGSCVAAEGYKMCLRARYLSLARF
jgi:hypothetical protein